MNSILRRIRADSQIGRNELLARCELTEIHISLELELNDEKCRSFDLNRLRKAYKEDERKKSCILIEHVVLFCCFN